MPDLTDRSTRRQLIEDAYRAGLDRVAPDEAVRQVLRRDGTGLLVDGERLPIPGRLVVVAIGKAATPMATAALGVIGDRIDAGYLLTKEGHAEQPPQGFTVFEAAHPVPDQRGIDASRTILDAVRGLGPDDVVIALISGGGSALFEAPAGDVTLDDIQQTTSLLLRAGAPIQDLNAVRSELSEVKGGGFRRQAGQAQIVSLILSDVLGNPPEIIASGPTVARDPAVDAAIAVLDRYELRDQVPEAVARHLDQAREQASPNRDSQNDLYRIVGDNEAFVAAIEQFFVDRGLSVERVWREQEGEARVGAGSWVDALAETTREVIIGGGEMTVTVTGDGTGGRNTEFALAAAIELDRRNLGGTVASLASDGQDGSIDAAGGVVDRRTVDELRAAGIDPADAMARNDSGTVLGVVNALVESGPTGTNVNDVYIGLTHES